MSEANGLPGERSEHLRAVHGAARRARRAGREGQPRGAVRAGARRAEDTRPAGQVVALAVRDSATRDSANALRALALICAPSRAARARRRRARRAGADGLASGKGVAGLSYLRACISEAMRLWPTTPLLSRETLVELSWRGARRPGRDADPDLQRVPPPRPRAPRVRRPLRARGVDRRRRRRRLGASTTSATGRRAARARTSRCSSPPSALATLLTERDVDLARRRSRSGRSRCRTCSTTSGSNSSSPRPSERTRAIAGRGATIVQSARVPRRARASLAGTVLAPLQRARRRAGRAELPPDTSITMIARLRRAFLAAVLTPALIALRPASASRTRATPGGRASTACC